MKKRSRVLLPVLSVLVLLLFATGLYYYVPAIPPEALNRKYEVKPSQYLKVNGMEVHYRAEGPLSDSLPLVLLHGTSSSLFAWNGWVELLKDRHRIVRLDLPGFGLTGPHPEGDYDVETYLNFLQSFLSELGIEKCIIAGNSLGGEIAWRYALNNPGQVKKLILIGAAGYPVDIEKLPLSRLPLSYLWLRVPLIRELSVRFTTPQVMHESLEYLYGDPEKVTEEVTEIYFDMTHREGNREALTERMESFGRPAPWQEIPEIDIPVLILWGEQDRLIPVENARRFHRDLPRSRLVIFPEAGHMPMEEIPEKSAKAAEQFINN